MDLSFIRSALDVLRGSPAQLLPYLLSFPLFRSFFRHTDPRSLLHIRRKEEGDELGLTAKDGPDQLSGRGQDLAAATSTLRLATSASALLRLRPCLFSLDVLQMFCAIRLRSFFLAQHSLFFVPSSATSPHVLCPISLPSLLVRHLSYTLSFLILYSLVPSC